MLDKLITLMNKITFNIRLPINEEAKTSERNKNPIESKFLSFLMEFLYIFKVTNIIWFIIIRAAYIHTSYILLCILIWREWMWIQ